MCLRTCVNMRHFGLQSAEGGWKVCVGGKIMDDKKKVQNLFNLKPLLDLGQMDVSYMWHELLFFR